MKYLKTYEKHNGPEIGDYVLCEEKYIVDKSFRDFIFNNVGVIIDIEIDGDENWPGYIVKYENVSNDIKPMLTHEKLSGTMEDCRLMRPTEIRTYSKNKEDLETILDANNYNL